MDLKEILKVYVLQRETDFAVLIDGPWGSGKTHFLKNELGPLIAKLPYTVEIKSGKEEDIPYELVYISLFGLTSLEDLQKKLFVEINPILKTKVAKGILFAANKFMQTLSAGADEDDSIELMNILGGIKPNKVLVFDDLERLPDELLNKVMGFINTYTEHQGLKVIIIAHENIISTKVDNYLQIKEKLIRFTYTYAPDLAVVLPTFLARYNDDDLTTYVNTHKQVLFRSFEKGEHINLRTLRFFLDLFFFIFNEVKKVQNLEDESKIELLQHFYFFLLTYSIEYKKNGIDNAKQQSLKDLSAQLQAGGITSFFEAFDDLLTGNEQQESPQPDVSFIKDFEDRYLENSGQTFRYYEFIVEYVHSGNLNFTNLDMECQTYNNQVKAAKTLPQFAAYKKLENCLLLDDEDFQVIYKDVLDAAANGLYPLEIYPKLFEIITNCTINEVHGVTIDTDLIQAFKAGMDKSIVNSTYKGPLTFMSHTDNEQLNEIRSYAKELNESLLENQQLQHFVAGQKIFRAEDFDKLDTFLQEETAQTTIFKVPHFDPNDFVKQFLSMKNLQKRKCIEVIQKSFERFSHQNMDQKEVQFWNQVYKDLLPLIPSAPGSNTMSGISVRDLTLTIRKFVPLPEIRTVE